MPVYLPTAALGNGRVLATLGGAGEIMAFFYPHVDFAQNVREALPALYIGDPGHGVFHWTFEPAFRRRQAYLPDTNLVRTELALATPPLEILLEDFCPPDTTSLIRRVLVINTGDGPFHGTFFHYFELRLREVAGKQAVRWDDKRGYVLQYFRNTVIALGGTRPELWRCGKSLDPAGPQSAKSDLYDGHLNGQPEDIGQVDFAVGYRLDLAPGQERALDLFLCAEDNPERTSLHMQELVDRGYEGLRSATMESDRRWLAEGRPVQAGALQAAYERALLSLRLLIDEATGAVIAAPEFDPAYERSGGYGYCWPRDASWAVASLHQAGYPQYTRRLADWYAAHQLPSGFWSQRYWSQGQLAASWALREDFLQLDQSAAAVLTLCGAAAEEEDAERQAVYRQAVARGAEALRGKVEAGWHTQACDLWETYCGSFVYTNAALTGALEAAGRCAAEHGEAEVGQRYMAQAEEMRQATLALYNGEYFPRGRWSDGRLDPSVDTSTLGLVAPFALLDLTDPAQRGMAESNLAVIRHRLGQDLGGKRGLRRFEGDAYLGGVIGCVNTLWAALVSLKLAAAWKEEEAKRSGAYRRQALDDLDFCLAHATPTGLLSELIGLQPDAPYWAAPHAWASALLLDCVHELDALG
jgi:oligosaccharide amylase